MTASGDAGAQEVTGWKSRFDIALQTRHRIVLYGNTEDRVFDAGAVVTLTDWLRARFQQAGFTRIVRYNHVEPPRIIVWDVPPAPDADVQAALAPFFPPQARRTEPADPTGALRALANLARAEPRAAVIVENAQLRFQEPTLEAALLRQVKRESSDGAIANGVIVHVYSHESSIPLDFFKGDPDTAVVRVSAPSFEDRLAFFEQMAANTPLLLTTESGGRVSASRLARLTEGYALRELQQIEALSSQQPASLDIGVLLGLFRHGRLLDYWVRQRLDEIRDGLTQAVRGQNDAIDQVIDMVCKAKHRITRLIDESVRTPAMVLFFVGATGVGKTHMARALCRALTGTEENLKRIDMAEYKQEHSDQRLIGPPPGYVGHLEGGQLTNWIIDRPHSVVLIDEVEKAHPRILDIFMQMLEGARLTDGKGLTVDLSETILIFTSNIGGTEAEEEKISRGSRAEVDAYFRRQVEQYFDEDLERPEIFNRLKRGVVVFDYIEEDLANRVIQDRLDQIATAVERRLGNRVRFRFDRGNSEDQAVAAALLRRTNFKKYGLRDVNNILYEDVGGPLSWWLDEGHEDGDWRYRWNETEDKVEIRPR